MKRLKLIELNQEYKRQVMEYKEAPLRNQDSFDGCAGLEEVEEYDDWLDFEKRLQKKYGAAYVPSTVRLAIDRVLVTCDKANAASAKTIIRNGGVLENEVEDTVGLGEGETIQRYWIQLSCPNT